MVSALSISLREIYETIRYASYVIMDSLFYYTNVRMFYRYDSYLQPFKIFNKLAHLVQIFFFLHNTSSYPLYHYTTFLTSALDFYEL